MSYKEDGANLFPTDDSEFFVDGGVDYVDTWLAMEELVDEGLIRSIGLSNFNRRQVERVLAKGRIFDNEKLSPSNENIFHFSSIHSENSPGDEPNWMPPIPHSEASEGVLRGKEDIDNRLRATRKPE